MVGGISGISEYLNQVVSAFGTPRQGPIDTTNPEAVKARNPALAATPTDANQPPKPVASKVVQPGQGADFDPMAAFMQQQAAAAEQARKDAFGANLARAGAAMGSVLTRSPSARQALSGMVGGVSTGGGGGGGGGAGGLSFDAFSNYAKLLDTKKRRPQLIEALMARTGKPASAFEGLDDTTLNNVAQVALTPKIEKVTLANGDIVTIDTSDPKAIAQLRLTDPDAAQKLEDERTSKKLDVAKTAIQLQTEQRQQQESPSLIASRESETKKRDLEANKLAFERDERDLLAGNYDSASKALGIPEQELQLMGVEETRKRLAEKYKRYEPTTDIKEMERENEQRMKLNLPDMPPFRTLGEYQEYKDRLDVNKKRIEAGLPVAAKEIYTVTGDAAKSNSALTDAYAARTSELNLLRGGDLIQGTAWSEPMMAVRSMIARATGGIDTAVTQTQARTVLAAQDAMSMSKSLPGQLSDKDVLFLNKIAAGDIGQDPEAARHVLSLQNLLQRKKMMANNESIERLNERVPEAVYRPATVYDIDDDMRRYTDNTEINTMLKDPRKFDIIYGKGSAENYLQNFDKVVAAKMQVQGKTAEGRPTNTFNTLDKGALDAARSMTTEQFEQMGPTLTKLYEKKYGAQGEGLYDMILAAKKRNLFGG